MNMALILGITAFMMASLRLYKRWKNTQCNEAIDAYEAYRSTDFLPEFFGFCAEPYRLEDRGDFVVMCTECIASILFFVAYILSWNLLLKIGLMLYVFASPYRHYVKVKALKASEYMDVFERSQAIKEHRMWLWIHGFTAVFLLVLLCLMAVF